MSLSFRKVRAKAQAMRDLDAKFDRIKEDLSHFVPLDELDSDIETEVRIKDYDFDLHEDDIIHAKQRRKK